MKKILKVAALPFIVSAIVLIMFLLAALIPQKAILANAETSADQLFSHHQWEIVFNKGDPTYELDLYTDTMIIMQSYNMNMDDPSSILRNPRHISEKNEWNLAIALNELIREGAENESNYSRYWMGFRLVFRPLLLIGDYYTVRKIVAAVFFILMVLCAALIGKRYGIKGALCFGIPMALMNPAVISHSLQFSCDFILAFVFMLFVLLADLKKIGIPVMFCAFGVLTQLFDFYSTPLITYALPLILILVTDEFADKRWKTTLTALAAWGYGYVFMWISKMICTTLFTDINGFREAFNSFAGRVGIRIDPSLAENYDAVKALRLVYNNIFIDNIGNAIFLALAVASVAAVVVSFMTRTKREALSLCVFLFIAVLPLLWFAVAAQPTVIHYWFQYRTVIVAFAALFVYLTYAYSKAPKLLKK